MYGFSVNSLYKKIGACYFSWEVFDKLNNSMIRNEGFSWMKFDEHRKMILMKSHIKRFNTLSFTSNHIRLFLNPMFGKLRVYLLNQGKSQILIALIYSNVNIFIVECVHIHYFIDQLFYMTFYLSSFLSSFMTVYICQRENIWWSNMKSIRTHCYNARIIKLCVIWRAI